MFRIGYGTYEREVRVAQLHEDLTNRTVGFWVSTDRCYKLEVGDNLVATASIMDATEDKKVIPAGVRCKFFGFDSDGDVLLGLLDQGTPRPLRRVIFHEDLDSLSLE